jgi:hypothetical protein
VVALLSLAGDTKPLGKNWVPRFMDRHPDLKRKYGRRQEASRFNNFTPKAVN